MTSQLHGGIDMITYDASSKCECCPYGYHIDVDFLKFVDVCPRRPFRKNTVLHNSHSDIGSKNNKKQNTSSFLENQNSKCNGKQQICSTYKTTIEKYCNERDQSQCLTSNKTSLQDNEFDNCDSYHEKYRGNSEPNLDRNVPTVGSDVLIVLPRSVNQTPLYNNNISMKIEDSNKKFKSKTEVFIVDKNCVDSNHVNDRLKNQLLIEYNNERSINFLDNDHKSAKNIYHQNKDEENRLKMYNQYNSCNQNIYNSNDLYGKFKRKDIGLQCKPNVRDVYVATNASNLEFLQNRQFCDASVQYDATDSQDKVKPNFIKNTFNYYLDSKQPNNLIIDNSQIQNNKEFIYVNQNQNNSLSNEIKNEPKSFNKIMINKSKDSSEYNTEVSVLHAFRHPTSNYSSSELNFVANKYNYNSNKFPLNTQDPLLLNESSNLISVIETEELCLNKEIQLNKAACPNMELKNDIYLVNEKDILSQESNNILENDHLLDQQNIKTKLSFVPTHQLNTSKEYQPKTTDDGKLSSNITTQDDFNENKRKLISEDINVGSKMSTVVNHEKLDTIDNLMNNEKLTNIDSSSNYKCESPISITPLPRIVDLLESSDSDFAEDEMPDDYYVYHVNKEIVQVQKINCQNDSNHDHEFLPIKKEESYSILREDKQDVLEIQPEYIENLSTDNINLIEINKSNISDKLKTIETALSSDLKENITLKTISNTDLKTIENNKVMQQNINDSSESIEDSVKYINDFSSESLMSTSDSSLENLLGDSIDNNNTFSSPDLCEKPVEDVLDLKRKADLKEIELNKNLPTTILPVTTTEVLNLYSPLQTINETVIDLKNDDPKKNTESNETLKNKNDSESELASCSNLTDLSFKNDIQESHPIKPDSFDSTDDTASVDTIRRSTNLTDMQSKDVINSENINLTKYEDDSTNKVSEDDKEDKIINKKEMSNENISSSKMQCFLSSHSLKNEEQLDSSMNKKSECSINVSTSNSSFDSLEKKIASLKRLSSKRKNPCIDSQSIPTDSIKDIENLIDILASQKKETDMELCKKVRSQISDGNYISFSQPDLLENLRSQDSNANISMDVLKLILNSSRSVDTGLDTQYIFQQYMATTNNSEKNGSCSPKTLVQLSVENIQRYTKSFRYSMVSSQEEELHETINHAYREPPQSSSHDTLLGDEHQRPQQLQEDSASSCDAVNLLEAKCVSAPAILSEISPSQSQLSVMNALPSHGLNSESEEQLLHACLSVAHHLNETNSNNDQKEILNIELIRCAWFATCSRKQSTVGEVNEMLNLLRQFGDELLQMVVNMVDVDGNTALHYAVSHVNIPVIELLLSVGLCNVDTQNSAGYTVNMLATLLLPLEEGRQSALLAHMFQIGEVNAASERTGQTALMLASSHGREDMVELLLQAGSDVNTQDEDGSTALMCASEHNHINIVKLLLAHPMCNSSLSDIDGSTALSIAMEEGNQEIGVLIYTHIKKNDHFQDSTETLE